MIFGRNVSDVDVMFRGRIASKVNNETNVGNISAQISTTMQCQKVRHVMKCIPN